MTSKLSIIGGIATALVIFALAVSLLSTRATLAKRTGDLNLANAKLEVSKASVDRLTSDLARATAQQQELAADDAMRIQASREVRKVVDAAAEVRQAAIDKLKASAAAVRPTAAELPSACQFSEATVAEWK